MGTTVVVVKVHPKQWLVHLCGRYKLLLMEFMHLPLASPTFVWIFLLHCHVVHFLNSNLPISWNSFNFGKVPFLVAKWTYGARLEPTLNTIQMKDVTAVAKRNGQAVIIRRTRIRLIFNTWLVQ